MVRAASPPPDVYVNDYGPNYYLPYQCVRVCVRGRDHRPSLLQRVSEIVDIVVFT